MGRGRITLFVIAGAVTIVIAAAVCDLAATASRGFIYRGYHFFSYLLNTDPVIKQMPRVSADVQFSGDGLNDNGFAGSAVTFCNITDWPAAYWALRSYTATLDFPVVYGPSPWQPSPRRLQIFRAENCLHAMYSETDNN